MTDVQKNFDEILRRATGVFESKENAQAWLRRPCRALGGISPESLLDKPSGDRLVLDELNRIVHGVYY